MIAGLIWNQQYISRFGGNKKQVVIGGNSSGGMAVSQLSLIPKANGLFHGAIPMSGVATPQSKQFYSFKKMLPVIPERQAEPINC